MNRRVEGVYATTEEAMAAVQRLRDEGYSRNDIFIVANEDVRNSIPYTMDAEVTTDTEAVSAGAGDEDRSLWEKIKDAFTVDDSYDASAYDHPDYDSSNDPLAAHHDDIARGNIVVLLDSDATPAVSEHPGYASTPGDDNDTGFARKDRVGTMAGTDDVVGTRDTHLDRDRDLDLDKDETIELREEELDVGTREVQTGEVRVGKRIVEETETVDVPVTHEEVTIERRPVTDRRAVDGDIDLDLDEKEIVVPVTEEQVQIDKHTEVAEEVDVHKEKVTDNKRVTETVRREELDVDSTGNVHVDGADVHHDHDVLDRDRDRMTHDDRSILDKGRDALDRDNDGKVFDNDRNRATHDDRSILDKGRDALDRDNDGKVFDNDRDRKLGDAGMDGADRNFLDRNLGGKDGSVIDNDADRRTMDSDRGLLDNDPDRDRRI